MKCTLLLTSADLARPYFYLQKLKPLHRYLSTCWQLPFLVVFGHQYRPVHHPSR